MKGKLQEGDVAPEFSLPDQDGRMVSSQDIKEGRSWLYFLSGRLPKSAPWKRWPFRQMHEGFQRPGEVIGVPPLM